MGADAGPEGYVPNLASHLTFGSHPLLRIELGTSPLPSSQSCLDFSFSCELTVGDLISLPTLMDFRCFS